MCAERVVDELEFLVKKYHADSIAFVDNNFFVDKERVRKICQGFINRKINVKWGNASGCTSHLVNFDNELWDLLQRSGCHSILIGAESGSQEMLDLIHKDTTVEDTICLNNICNRCGIHVSFSLMTGFPPNSPNNKARAEGELKKELRQTVGLIYKVLSSNRKHDIKLFFYTPYPGSPLYDLSVQKGFHEPRNLEEWALFELDNVNTRWNTNEFESTMHQIRRYAIPYYQGSAHLQESGRGFMRLMAGWLLQKLAGLRLKYGYFSLPIEYKVITAYLRRRDISFETKTDFE